MITYTIRKQAFCKLQELSFSYFDVNSSGWILARLTSDTKKLASIVSWGIVDALWAVIVMLGKNAIPSKIEDITETSDKLIKEGYNMRKIAKTIESLTENSYDEVLKLCKKHYKI